MEKAMKKYFPIFMIPTMIAFAIGFLIPFLLWYFLIILRLYNGCRL